MENEGSQPYGAIEKPDPETILNNLLEQFSEQSGRYWGAYVHPLRGDFEQEIGDVRWVALQMLVYWSSATETPLLECVRDFLLNFWAELVHLRAQGAFATDGENASSTTAMYTNSHCKRM